jgi:dephospho-CoA kinase
VWLITCDPDVQRGRLLGRGSTLEDAEVRIEAQAGLVERIRPAATLVVDASGKPSATRAIVEAAFDAALSSTGIARTGGREG